MITYVTGLIMISLVYDEPIITEDEQLSILKVELQKKTNLLVASKLNANFIVPTFSYKMIAHPITNYTHLKYCKNLASILNEGCNIHQILQFLTTCSSDSFLHIISKQSSSYLYSHSGQCYLLIPIVFHTCTLIDLLLHNLHDKVAKDFSRQSYLGTTAFRLPLKLT